MTTGTVKTQGTKLYFAYAGSSSEIHRVACPTGITGLGGAANQISRECLDSIEMEYDRGLKDPGQVSVPFNVIPRSASHQALLDLDESGDETSWMIVLSDQAGAPSSTDSEGRLISPGPTSVEFLGYLSDIEVDIQTNEIVRGTLTLQRSGAKVWDLPAADLA